MSRRNVLVMLVLIVGAGLAAWPAADRSPAQSPVASEPATAQLQPPPGAVMTDVALRSGETVEQKTIVVRIETPGQPAPGLAQFIRLLAVKARLNAESAGATQITFPNGFEIASEAAQTVAATERRLFAAKLESTNNQKAQLAERIAQIELDVVGLEAQLAAKQQEMALVQRELKLVETLHKKNLTNEVRLIGMQREFARFQGEEKVLQAQITRVKGQIRELELQTDAIDTAMALDAEKELRDVENEINSLVESNLATDASGVLLPSQQGMAMAIPAVYGDQRAAAAFGQAALLLPAAVSALPEACHQQRNCASGRPQSSEGKTSRATGTARKRRAAAQRPALGRGLRRFVRNVGKFFRLGT